ncbi:MAG: hypothetical protein RIS90_892 [Pseudomonadota bacterium]|jgi:hypothetical protein
MKPALLMLLLLPALLATALAQPAPRREPRAPAEVPEQRRTDLRSVLKQAPPVVGPGAEAPLEPTAPWRRLTEEERASLRQQLRQQAGEGASPDGRNNRATAPCSREPARKTTRSADDNCY